MPRFENVANARNTHDIGKFVRIKNDSCHATWCDNARKLGKHHHRAFDMHVTIDESRSQPTPLQVAFLAPLITVPVARSTDTYDSTISYGNISVVTFAATHINKLCITQDQIGRHFATGNLDATLQSGHHKNTFSSLVFLEDGSKTMLHLLSCCRTYYQKLSNYSRGKKPLTLHPVSGCMIVTVNFPSLIHL